MNMEQLLCFALVALGGAVGAVLRYGIGQMVEPNEGIAWGTFIVNFIGCFLICLLFFKFTDMSKTTMAFLFIGLFGAFTTLSSVSLEMVTFFTDGQIWNALAVFLLNAVVCVGAGFVGRAVALLL